MTDPNLNCSFLSEGIFTFFCLENFLETLNNKYNDVFCDVTSEYDVVKKLAMYTVIFDVKNLKRSIR